MVKFDFSKLPIKYHSKYPFRDGASYIFLGEISNMKGHCVIAAQGGVIHFGYHTDNFIELTEKEV